RERTGYPLEVLQLDLDVEADLGIDSIKRVEILGKLRDAFPQLASPSDPEGPDDMDGLTRATTLGAIVDRVERILGRRHPVTSAAPTAAPASLLLDHGQTDRSENGRSDAEVDASADGELRGGARRLLLDVVDAPIRGQDGGLMPGGTILITEDDLG